MSGVTSKGLAFDCAPHSRRGMVPATSVWRTTRAPSRRLTGPRLPGLSLIFSFRFIQPALQHRHIFFGHFQKSYSRSHIRL